MEEDHLAILVSEGAIKSIKLSLSTGEEIVSSTNLMLLPVILAYRDAFSPMMTNFFWVSEVHILSKRVSSDPP